MFYSKSTEKHGAAAHSSRKVNDTSDRFTDEPTEPYICGNPMALCEPGVYAARNADAVSPQRAVRLRCL
ncbi:hypothetical protein M513_08638 [Trichuris suis]|uniref:Uncharacterized protein n=1 Tax=Trichuris suis TaxID=68888 RepID=A0A085LZL5_9BILA|nr:hypothetical protein M513_08638 [Trichuris suis]